MYKYLLAIFVSLHTSFYLFIFLGFSRFPKKNLMVSLELLVSVRSGSFLHFGCSWSLHHQCCCGLLHHHKPLLVVSHNGRPSGTSLFLLQHMFHPELNWCVVCFKPQPPQVWWHRFVWYLEENAAVTHEVHKKRLGLTLIVLMFGRCSPLVMPNIPEHTSLSVFCIISSSWNWFSDVGSTS